MPPVTDLQYKDELRKQLVILERWLSYIKENRLDELRKKIETDIKRINMTLQD